MNKVLIALFLTVFSALPPALAIEQPSLSKDNFSVATFNIGRCFAFCTINNDGSLSHKPSKAVFDEVLRLKEQGADVILLQETNGSDAYFKALGAKLWGNDEENYRRSYSGYHGKVIFSRLPIQAYEGHAASDNRVIVRTVIQHPFDPNESLVLGNTHLNFISYTNIPAQNGIAFWPYNAYHWNQELGVFETKYPKGKELTIAGAPYKVKNNHQDTELQLKAFSEWLLNKGGSCSAQDACHAQTILAGDFNYRSHLDRFDNRHRYTSGPTWVKATPWAGTKYLAENKWIDTFRAANPDDRQAPGITAGGWNQERIDYIYYRNQEAGSSNAPRMSPIASWVLPNIWRDPFTLKNIKNEAQAADHQSVITVFIPVGEHYRFYDGKYSLQNDDFVAVKHNSREYKNGSGYFQPFNNSRRSGSIDLGSSDGWRPKYGTLSLWMRLSHTQCNSPGAVAGNTQSGGWALYCVKVNGRKVLRAYAFSKKSRRYETIDSDIDNWKGGNWHHVTLRYGRGELSLHHDGIKVASKSIPDSPMQYNVLNHFQLFAEASYDNRAAGSYFSGDIASVLSSPVALSDSTIAIMAHRGATTELFPLVNDFKSVITDKQMTGAATITPKGAEFYGGQSLYLDSQAIRSPTLTVLGEYKFNDCSQRSYLFSSMYGDGYGITYSNGKLIAYVLSVSKSNGASRWFAVSHDWKCDDNWHDIAFSFDGRRLLLSVDGRVQSTDLGLMTKRPASGWATGGTNIYRMSEFEGIAYRRRGTPLGLKVGDLSSSRPGGSRGLRFKGMIRNFEILPVGLAGWQLSSHAQTRSGLR